MHHKTRTIKIGNIEIGGNAPIAVQSMTTTKTWKVEDTVNQIKELEKVGCEMVRVAVPDRKSAEVLKEIKAQINIPLIADVHFRHELALIALRAGVDKIRINPGTLKNLKKVKEVVLDSRKRKIPIRIGVNAGSLHPKYAEAREDLPHALVESVLEYVRFCENLDFNQMVLSVKASSVPATITAYQNLAKKVDYPLHLGITEAGTLLSGTIKSAVGLGILLSQGIGNTIRISLAADPIKEVHVAYQILQALGLRNKNPELIACPTCGRCEIDLISLAREAEEKLLTYNNTLLKVAVMGCVVNGPGEAREADIGIAGGKKGGILFKKGEPFRKVSQDQLLDSLMKEVKNFSRGKEGN